MKEKADDLLRDFLEATQCSEDKLLTSREPEFVDLRDIFIEIASLRLTPDPTVIMGAVKRERSSYYAARERFALRYKMYREYRDKFYLINQKIR